jgi:hypothetical protein
MTPTGIYNPAISSQIGQGKGTEIIQTLLKNSLTLAFIIGTIVALFFLINGAISWISSGGDKEKMHKAQGKITGAVIGLFAFFCLYAILRFISEFFGIDLLILKLPIIE